MGCTVSLRGSLTPEALLDQGSLILTGSIGASFHPLPNEVAF